MSINFAFVLMFSNVLNVTGGRVILTLYALHLGATPLQVGTLAATFALFPMLLSWLAGRLVDRFGSRPPIMVASAVSAAGMLLPLYLQGLPALYAGGAALGFSLAFFSISTQNLVGHFSDQHNRTRNFSNYTMLGSVASFLGPLLGGLIIEHLGHTAALVSLVVLPLIPIAQLAVWGRRLPGGSRRGRPAGSVRQALGDRKILRILVISSLGQCANCIFQFYLPVYGQSVGMSASTIGMVLAMVAAAGFVSRMSLPRLINLMGARNVLACAFAVGAVSIVMIPFFTSTAVIAGLALLFGLGMNSSQPITMMSMYSNSKDGRSGEALGLRFSADNLTKLVSPILFGALASAMGLGAVFWISAFLLGCGSWMSREKRA